MGLGIDDRVWDHSVFAKNRDRLLTSEIAQDFLAALLAEPKIKRLLSHEHFSVDGTLLKAWASMKSFRAKDGSGKPPTGGRNGERDFKKKRRSNETHESTTDPDARLHRKGQGQESRLCYMGHVLMENRNGLAILGEAARASGTAERDAALGLIDRRRPERRITVGADKAYDVVDFVQALRARQVTPHIAIDGHVTKTGKTRKTGVDKRITRHPGYAISQCYRKRIEEIFGWTKTIGGLAQLKLRGLAKATAAFTFGPWRLTISSECQSSWRPQHERPSAHHRDAEPATRPLRCRQDDHAKSRNRTDHYKAAESCCRDDFFNSLLKLFRHVRRQPESAVF